MLDAYIIDRIRRRKEDGRDERDQPSVDDLDDGRPHIDIKQPEKPSERGVADITDCFRIDLQCILRE